MPKCFKCGKVVRSINGLKRHFKFVQNLDKYTAVYKCVETDCYVTSSSWVHLRRHLNLFHNFCANDNAKVDPYLVEQPLQNNNIASNKDAQPMIPPDNDVVSNSKEFDSKSLNEHVETYASQLVARLYSKPGRPRSFVQEFVNDTSEFLSSTLSVMDEIIKFKLESKNIDPTVIKEISDTLSILKSPFKDLSTEYLRLKFLKSKQYYVEPENLKIDTDLFARNVNNKIILESDHVIGTFIPLRKVLKAFLELPNVLSSVTNFLQSPTPQGIISDFIHGSHWQTKKRHFGDKRVVIPLTVYTDDYEVDKELGPHSAKLTATYVKFACLLPEFQGSLYNIFLVLLFNARDREDFGNKAVFRKLIE